MTIEKDSSNVVQLFVEKDKQEKFRHIRKKFYRMVFLDLSEKYLKAEYNPALDKQQSNS